MNLSDWRKEYDKYKLELSELKNNPVEQFKDWFSYASETSDNEVNAMSLSTCSKNSIPSSRMVLLKGIEDQKFVFYSNYNSHKAKDLEENPHASLLFFWEKNQRQVRISGTVKKGTREQSIAYFNSRPKDSQIAAIASAQSEPVDMDELINRIEDLAKLDSLTCPDHWGAYLFEPYEFEFWQGKRARLHDRFKYTLNKLNQWNIERLSP
jgi:pyridoxamine 5'-phosphate oxidase